MKNQFNHTSTPGRKMYRVFLWILSIAFMAWYLAYFFNTVPVSNPESESFIESFVFQKSKNENLIGDIQGMVNNEARIVYFQNPNNTDLIYLEPTIIFNEKVASNSPQGSQDFSKPFVYTLTLKNGEEIQFYILNEKPPDGFNTNNNF